MVNGRQKKRGLLGNTLDDGLCVALMSIRDYAGMTGTVDVVGLPCGRALICNST